MTKLLETIRQNRMQYHELILHKIEDFIYRDKRYTAHFAIVLMYVQKNTYSNALFNKILRKTDAHIRVDTHLHAIVFDSISNETYIKATENIQYTLQNHHDNQFYISVVESESCHHDYFKMIHDAFDILEYTMENNMTNVVMDQIFDI